MNQTGPNILHSTSTTESRRKKSRTLALGKSSVVSMEALSLRSRVLSPSLPIAATPTAQAHALCAPGRPHTLLASPSRAADGSRQDLSPKGAERIKVNRRRRACTCGACMVLSHSGLMLLDWIACVSESSSCLHLRYPRYFPELPYRYRDTYPIWRYADTPPICIGEVSGNTGIKINKINTDT
jgi:UDP:flavonoid glycosyltransferase YjiC (YdhE family)